MGDATVLRWQICESWFPFRRWIEKVPGKKLPPTLEHLPRVITAAIVELTVLDHDFDLEMRDGCWEDLALYTRQLEEHLKK